MASPLAPSAGTPRAASPLHSDDAAHSLSPPVHDDAHTMATPNEAEAVRKTSLAANPATASASDDAASNAPKGKEKVAKGPLRLLDLPVDILKEIIHQLPHTNDLTSLSLCHSALHRLTIPCIYSRFDIVWPDESTHTEPRSGVDALTYGLATLVMGDDCFPHQNRLRQQGTSPRALVKPAATPYPVQPRRFGNYYGQFTKKFSLGNGPPAWVQEYMITKEGGKMLGTLVALAIARMVNLETFVWDMPTGVLRDVWLALSSLAHRSDGEDCRLERLWIRWHDNTIDSPMPPPAPPMILNPGVPPPPGTTHPSGLGTVQSPAVAPQPYLPSSVSALDRVEHPTFSAIPALKSLSVLDIDELPYLDEMSILIARSQKKLRELRVGIAPHAQQRDWVTVWEGDGLQQVDYSVNTTAASTLGEKRLGGVLGILVGRVHNMRHSEDSQPPKTSAVASAERPAEATPSKSTTSNILPSIASLSMQDREAEPDVDHFGNPMEESEVIEQADLVDDDVAAEVEAVTAPLLANPHRTPSKPRTEATAQGLPTGNKHTDEPPEELLNGKLKLEVLELERVPLSVPVLRRAFDWSILSTLTLLHCSNHEQLWKVLRREYTPRSSFPGSPSPSKAYKASYTLRSEYQLNLKRIHTNTVSPALISFLKETLAPNSLEVLFLQESRSYSSTVTVDAIYRGPMRRHRSSLKKLMIDSDEKGPDGHSSRWRRWMLNREILTFITSGRMSNLRELAVSIEYKDWHHFLQRLPYIPHIRSLYIPFIADHTHGNNIDLRELAYQILDIVHLRPEIELCYMGLSSKCFEILENRPSNYDLRHDGMHADGSGSAYATQESIMSDDESEATEDEDDDDADDSAVAPAGDETESEASDDNEVESDNESFMQETHKGPKLRVREILFYEERVEAFRRRHGVLRP